MVSRQARLIRLACQFGVAPQLSLAKPLAQQRRRMERIGRVMPVPSGISIRLIADEQCTGEWVEPKRPQGTGVMLYLHGGAYTLGSPRTHRLLAAHLARATGRRLFLPDYRLAPEHPFPAALEDAMAAYRWLLRQVESSAQIVLAGDSAGGGLVLATLVALRDAHEPLPAATVCLSPWTDLAFTGESIISRQSADPLLTLPWLQAMANHYAGNHSRLSPLISPLYADLSHLPPLLIQVGSDEILLSDAQRLAGRAQQAGVIAQLEVWERMWHEWQFFAGQMPEARRAVEQINQFLMRHAP